MKPGWQVKELRELCDFFADGDWVESKDQSPSGIRLVQTGNIGEGVFKSRADKARYISEDTFKRLRCAEVYQGDFLISRLPEPVGRGCLIPETGERMITAVDCTIIRFNRNRILPEFFNYYSQSVEYLSAVEGEATGTTRKRISRKKLGQVMVPTPPLEEQQRIVGILDKAFAVIPVAKTNARRSEKLTHGIFQSKLQELFEEQNYGKVVLNDVCEFKGGGTPSKEKKEYWNGNIPWVSPKDMKFEIVRNSIDHISTDAITNSAASIIRKGAVLIVVRSGILARTVPLALTGQDLAINQDLKAVVPSESVLPKYLFYFLSSNMPELLSFVSKGATVHRIGADSLKSLKMALPPIFEQQRTVEKIEQLKGKIAAARGNFHRREVILDELKQGLLARAFSGSL